MSRHGMLGLVCVLVAAGCITGKSAEKHPLAIGPAGVQMDVRLRKSRIKGELLEVRDTALVILAPREVVLISFGSIRFAHFKSVDSPRLGPGASQKNIGRAKLLSRFPAGMPEPALRQILESRQQSSLTERWQ